MTAARFERARVVGGVLLRVGSGRGHDALVVTLVAAGAFAAVAVAVADRDLAGAVAVLAVVLDLAVFVYTGPAPLDCEVVVVAVDQLNPSFIALPAVPGKVSSTLEGSGS